MEFENNRIKAHPAIASDNARASPITKLAYIVEFQRSFAGLQIQLSVEELIVQGWGVL